MFLAPKARQQGHPPTLLQIKQAFPLPGRYHFRFKSPLIPGGDREKGGLAVWMDCTDDRQPVPVWQSQIVAKITRIGVEEEEDDDDEDDEDFRRPTTAAVGVPLSQPVPQPSSQTSMPRPPPPAQPPAPSFDLFGDGPTAHAPSNPSGYAGNVASMSANLLDTPMPSSTGTSGSSLLDMNYQQHPVAPPHSDFLGMTTAPSPPVSGNYSGYGVPQNQPRPPPSQPPQSRPNTSFGGSLHQGNGGAFGDLAWK